MTKHISETIRVNLPATKAWTVLDDFGGIERYAPTIKCSPILTEKPTGIGARRQCEFHTGGSLIEEIVDYKDGESMTLELSDHRMPQQELWLMTPSLRIGIWPGSSFSRGRIRHGGRCTCNDCLTRFTSSKRTSTSPSRFMTFEGIELLDLSLQQDLSNNRG